MYVIAMVFAVIVCLLLAFVIFADAVQTVCYFRAERGYGRIVRCNGVERTANYGKHQPSAQYGSYEVSFVVKGDACFGTYLDKRKDLREGDMVFLRYVVNADGSVRIVNRNHKDRLFRLLVCAVVGIAWAAAIIILRGKA